MTKKTDFVEFLQGRFFVLKIRFSLCVYLLYCGFCLLVFALGWAQAEVVLVIGITIENTARRRTP